VKVAPWVDTQCLHGVSQLRVVKLEMSARQLASSSFVAARKVRDN